LRRKRGFAKQLLGLGLFAMTFVAWLAVRGIEGGMVITVISGALTTLGGVVVFARGILEVARTTRHLRTVTAMRQLPVARVR